MAVKRQSPAQRGVRISSRISLEMDEDGQRIKPGRSLSFDSGRYFCSVTFHLSEEERVKNY